MKSKSILRLLFVGLALIGVSTRSSADLAQSGVKEKYKEASASYNLGHYEQALSQFEDAYRMKSDPAFLFNIAQCQRQLHRYDEAENSYRAYLRESNAVLESTRSKIERIIDEMHVASKSDAAKHSLDLSARPATQTPQAVQPSTNVLTASPPPKSQPVYKKAWFWGVIGGAVAVVAVGVGVGVGIGAAPHNPSPSMGVVVKQ